ncbi:BBA14 family lipoprotein [Borrelia sp. RT1S]|uniref:BBA14 family lipoprotein n=1 Tax=Borrelia sp. RT1S TaxID=2898580 RepID=UPI001E382302|nr:BBA14 family lipoprotein [Borrelia sp. RT1S]UGQ17926.1 BBA14 family lipoprotein [Borrelia sp. RT1S]
MRSMFEDKNNKLMLMLLALPLLLPLMLLSCHSIAALPQEPSLQAGEDIEILVANEAELYKYCLKLNAWLVAARKYVAHNHPADQFPYFARFDSQYEGGGREAGLRARIAYYKKYAEETNPIARSIYAKYSKTSLE